MNKKNTAEDFFNKHSNSFIAFGELVAAKLEDEELVSALAERDLEKLVKVFKLIFDMLRDNSGGGDLGGLIEAYAALDEADGEVEP